MPSAVRRRGDRKPDSNPKPAGRGFAELQRAAAARCLGSRDSQAEAGPWVARALSPREALEHQVAVALRDPGAVIVDRADLGSLATQEGGTAWINNHRVRVVAAETSAPDTSPGDKLGEAARICAATPATCGAAIDVPDNVSVDVGEAMPSDTIADPGANTSRHEP